MRILAFVLVLLSAAASNTTAQVPVRDHWPTSEECLAATSAPFYYPMVINRRPISQNEALLGHPTGGCFDMVLPRDLGGRGWVRIEAGRQFVYDKKTGRVLRLAECDNDVHSWMPFPITAPAQGPQGLQGLQGPVGPMGPEGPRGPQGLSGTSFSPNLRQETVSGRPRWWSINSGTGKFLWGGVAAGVVGGICATKGCWLMEQTVNMTREPCGGTCR